MLNEPLPNSSPRTSDSASANSKCRKYLIITAVVLAIAFLIYLNYYFSFLYKDLYLITKKLVEERSVYTYSILIGLNVAFQMLFIPGISFFIIYLGFVTKSYLHTMLIIYPSTLVIAAMSYYLARYTIKEWLYVKLCHKWYYKLYSEKCRKAPMQTSWMLRVLLIPATYKNYLIAIMDLDFKSYMIPAVVHYLPYFSCYAIIGVSISTIEDAINGNIPKENKRAYYIFLGFIMLMMVASIFVIIYFSIMTVKKFKEHKKESIERSITSDAENHFIVEEKEVIN